MNLPLSTFSTAETFTLFTEIFVKAYEQKVEILVTMVRIMDKEKVHTRLKKAYTFTCHLMILKTPLIS